MTMLLFHSVYGLRPAVRDAAGRLRATGHEVVVPDLFDGRTAGAVEEGREIVAEIGREELARRAGAAAAPYDDDVVLAGFSLGAALAQDLAFAGRRARGLLLMHGTSDVPGALPAELASRGLPVQLHVADPDPFEPAGWLEEWEAGLRRHRIEPEIFRYPGPGHLFTDPGLADHDEEAAEQAWRRALAFVQEL
jgi:dienelactone hydrolase